MYIKSLAFSGLLVAATVAASEAAADAASDVVQLKKDTFEDFVKANDLVLAECKQFIP